MWMVNLSISPCNSTILYFDRQIQLIDSHHSTNQEETLVVLTVDHFESWICRDENGKMNIHASLFLVFLITRVFGPAYVSTHVSTHVSELEILKESKPLSLNLNY